MDAASMGIGSVTAMPSDAAVDARMVQQAIDRGVTYLKKSQTERGGWTEIAASHAVSPHFARWPYSIPEFHLKIR